MAFQNRWRQKCRCLACKIYSRRVLESHIGFYTHLQNWNSFTLLPSFSVNNIVNLNPDITILLNRLSDLFFVLARYENKISGIKDIEWQK